MRKRMIDPSVWGDADFGKLTLHSRLLWIGLISHADDDGRGEADPLVLRRAVFGFDEYTVEQVGEWVCEIDAKMRGVVFYEVEGRKYYALSNWRRYQYISRPAPSRYPPPPSVLDGWKEVTEKEPEEVVIAEDTYDEELGRVVREWEKVYGTINPAAMDELADMMAEWQKHVQALPPEHSDRSVIPEVAVREAIRESVRSADHPNLKYVRAVVRGWIGRGYKVERVKASKPTHVEDEMPAVGKGMTKAEFKAAKAKGAK